MNALTYLIEPDGLINIRNKEITLRPLDKVLVKEKTRLIQIANLAVPLLLLCLIAIIHSVVRNKKYKKPAKQ